MPQECATINMMTDLTRLLGKRAQLDELLNSLSELARSSIFNTVSSVSDESRAEYAACFATALVHSAITGDEYNWLMENLDTENAADRVFLARLAYELNSLVTGKLIEMDSPSVLRH